MSNSKPTQILITAGATREPIDEVRYLGNRSSGYLGNLLALAGVIDGFEVTLLRAENSVSPTSHPRLKSIPFTSTRDLSAKLREHWPSHDVLIMAAAVADFTPKGGQVHGKIQRGESTTISIIPTEDIVANLAKESRDDQQIIAFALEDPQKMEIRALEKLRRKNVDAIVANPLQTMESKVISAVVYCKDGRKLQPEQDLAKPAFARWLITTLLH